MWTVKYAKRFLKELSRLPNEIQGKAERIVFDELICINPFDLGYIEQMTGYSDKFKIRLGKYRIGLTIDKAGELLICQRIAHRKDIYKVFP